MPNRCRSSSEKADFWCSHSEGFQVQGGGVEELSALRLGVPISVKSTLLAPVIIGMGHRLGARRLALLDFRWATSHNPSLQHHLLTKLYDFLGLPFWTQTHSDGNLFL